MLWKGPDLVTCGIVLVEILTRFTTERYRNPLYEAIIAMVMLELLDSD